MCIRDRCPTPVPPRGCDEGTCTAHVRRKHSSIRTSQWISVRPTRSLPNQSPCARTHSISLSCRYLHGHEQHVDDHELPLHMEGRSVFRIVRAHMRAVPPLDTVCKSVAPAMTILMPSLIRGPGRSNAQTLWISGVQGFGSESQKNIYARCLAHATIRKRGDVT